MRAIVTTLLLLFAASSAQAVVQLIAPLDLSAPRPEPLRIAGLAPGETVEIQAIRRARGGQSTYVGRAVFVADAGGWVDTGVAAPTSGTYQGVDPLGLFWSAAPRAVEEADPPQDDVRLKVTDGTKELAATTVRAVPDLSTLEVSSNTPFPGAIWARPRTPGRHPVIIVLGGSEGGSSTAKALAPLFAARGYAVLGLPYYDPGYDPSDRLPSLPHSFTEIPVDRLETARAWIASQPDADAGRIGVWGGSKGAEFALIAASQMDWIKAVVAVVPSDLVWEGWGRPGPATASFAVDGKPLAFEPYVGLGEEQAKASRGGRMDMRRIHVEGRVAHPERVAAARIPIERFKGALLLVGGGRDAIWPSLEMARNIASTRAVAKEPTRLLVYADAGHGLGGPGGEPVASLATLGGEPAAIAHGRAEAWAATFELFSEALRP